MDAQQETIEKVRRDIAAWRRVQRRGPLPAALRRRAVAIARQLGVDAVAEALGIDAARVGRWVNRQDPVTSSVGPTGALSPFVDVGRQLAAAVGARGPHVPVGTFSVEVSMPCGTRVHLQGPLDAAMVEAIVRGATAAG